MLQLYRRSSDPSGKAILCHQLKHFDWRILYTLDSCADMVSYFYSVILSLLNHHLPVIKVRKCTTDKPWVTSGFRELIKKRQRAFMAGNLLQYHRLRNRSQRMAAKLRKNYFVAKVEQLHSLDPHQWWTKTKQILQIKDSDPMSSSKRGISAQ